MANTYELRAILSDADSLAALVRYYERGWDRILKTLALGIAKPAASRTNRLLAELRRILANLDPRRDSFVKHWVRDWIRKAFLAGETSAMDALPDGASRASARELSDQVGNTTAALASKLGFLAASMEASVAAALYAAGRAILNAPDLRGAVAAEGLVETSVLTVVQDLQEVVLDGANAEISARLARKGIPRFVTASLDKVHRGVVTVGKASVSIPAYVRQSGQDALGEAHNSASLAVAHRNEVDHVFVDKESSKKICPFCAQVEFNVFYDGLLAKDPAGFPRLKDLPPGPAWHPNCVHIVTPWDIRTKSPAEIAEALALALEIPADHYGANAVERVNNGLGGEERINDLRKHA